jgi:chemotaxis protein methyltransferase CheR
MTGGDGSEGSTGGLHGRHSLGPREFERLRRLIYVEAGISLSGTKRVLLESRLSKRLRALGLDSFEDYCACLDERRDDELVPFINCVTTNKTDFFREPHHFDFLRDHVLPAVDARARQTGDRRLRVWSAGCSTGEEPYTIAMLVREWLKGRPGWDIRILASDIDTSVLAAAAAGEYDADRLEGVSPEWRDRFFAPVPGFGDERRGRLRACPALRDLIAFRRINLNDEPWPIQATFDVIFCRNVIIYFDRDTQSRLLTRFARILKPDGHLIIGHSESLAWLSDTFTAVRGVPTAYKLAARAAIQRAPLPKPLSQGEGLNKLESPRDSGSPRLNRPPRPTTQRREPISDSGRLEGEGVPRGLTEKGSPHSLGEGGGGDEGPFHAVIGAQVLVCLFDADAAVGGATLVPCDATSNAASLVTSLMRQFEARGARAERLRAKVFGGAALPVAGTADVAAPADAAAAARTVDAVHAALVSLNVPVVAARTGGSVPLEIIFHTDTGRALVREAPIAVWRSHGDAS